MFSQSIGFMTVMLENLDAILREETRKINAINILESTKKSREIESGIQVTNWILSRSNQIIQLVLDLNNIFGYFLFWEIGLCIYKVIASLYMSMSFFEDSAAAADQVQNWKAFQNSHHLLQALLFFARLSILFHLGETISKQTLKLEESVMDFSLAVYDYLPNKTRTGLESLFSNLKNFQAPIRPLNGFKICLTNFLTAIGLIVTFVIILIQFKAESISCGSNDQ